MPSLNAPKVDIIIANKKYNDILFHSHLNNMSKLWNNELNVIHALSRENSIDEKINEGNNIHLGRIDLKFLETIMNGRTTAPINDIGHFWLLCGSRDFETEMRVTLIQGLNILEDNILTF